MSGFIYEASEEQLSKVPVVSAEQIEEYRRNLARLFGETFADVAQLVE